MFSQPLKRKWISEVVRIGSDVYIIVVHIHVQDNVLCLSLYIRVGITLYSHCCGHFRHDVLNLRCEECKKPLWNQWLPSFPQEEISTLQSTTERLRSENKELQQKLLGKDNTPSVAQLASSDATDGKVDICMLVNLTTKLQEASINCELLTKDTLKLKQVINMLGTPRKYSVGQHSRLWLASRLPVGCG